MPELLARAEFVDKIQAVCHSCGGAAQAVKIRYGLVEFSYLFL